MRGMENLWQQTAVSLQQVTADVVCSSCSMHQTHRRPTVLDPRVKLAYYKEVLDDGTYRRKVQALEDLVSSSLLLLDFMVLMSLCLVYAVLCASSSITTASRDTTAPEASL